MLRVQYQFFPRVYHLCIRCIERRRMFLRPHLRLNIFGFLQGPQWKSILLTITFYCMLRLSWFWFKFFTLHEHFPHTDRPRSYLFPFVFSFSGAGRGGLMRMTSTLDSWSSGPVSSPRLGTAICLFVFFRRGGGQDTLLLQCLYPPRCMYQCMSTSIFDAGGNRCDGLSPHPGGGGNTPSHFMIRNRDTFLLPPVVTPIHPTSCIITYAQYYRSVVFNCI